MKNKLDEMDKERMAGDDLMRCLWPTFDAFLKSETAFSFCPTDVCSITEEWPLYKSPPFVVRPMLLSAPGSFRNQL